MMAIMDATVTGQPVRITREQVEDREDFCRYECALKVNDLISRQGVILTGAVAGAGIGAGVGFAAGGPIGILPGAGIGAGVGAAAFAIGTLAYDYVEYTKHIKTLSAEAAQALEQKMCVMASDESEVCPITTTVPLVPVRIKGEKQVYEKEALEKWVKEHKTSPCTRAACKVKDIEFAMEGIPTAVRICETALCDPDHSCKFSEKELTGIRILRRQLKKNALVLMQKELNKLSDQLKKKPIETMDKINKLTEIMRPALLNDADL